MDWPWGCLGDFGGQGRACGDCGTEGYSVKVQGVEGDG